MNHSEHLKAQLFRRIYVTLIFVVSISLLAWFGVREILGLNYAISGAIIGATVLSTCLVFSRLLTKIVSTPLDALAQAILHVSPGYEENNSLAPNLEKVRLGRELITSLSLQVYQLASHESAKTVDVTSHRKEVIQATNVINHLPLPLFVFNSQLIVTNANEAGIEYCGATSAEIFGKPLEESLRLEFPSESTLDSWITECQKNKVTNTVIWERVHVSLPDGTVKQCDVSAHYNRDNPSGADFIVTLFDRTERYNDDDESMGFIAMAVHELRTPVTMLRGYIEVFEDELGDQLNDELKDFMHKMGVAANQLTIFVNNILNVARIEQNQLMMQLQEADWPKILNKALDDMVIRASIKGMTIERSIATDIPTVGIDKVSMYEVIANLIDNAIKYSPDKSKIIVSSTIGKNGTVETTVQDFGTGMPASVTANLFEKFYRNHRTRGKVGGTGLGLYLTKAIVSAHGGQVWVKSKENEGSTFGFSVSQYAQLADELKNSNNKDIVRQSHGWVKNHSMYRR
ncbi:hypothetical protein BH23PAT2_BH23PAT2_04940 [soil metagenome]